MEHPLIHNTVFCQPWAILPSAHYAIQDALERYATGATQDIRAGLHQVPFGPMAAGLGLTAPRERGSRVYTRGPLAVIPVQGILGSHLSMLETMCGGYDMAQLSHDLDIAAEDDGIKRVLLHFHSPGGTITKIPEVSNQLKKLGKTKETFGYTDGISASASYWVMCQCNHVYASESSGIGSIGVYLALLDRTKELEAKGQAIKLFKAGKHKAMGMPGNPLTREDEDLLQSQVDSTYLKFTTTVKKNRSGVKDEALQGQMFSAEDAVKHNLIDSLVNSLTGLVSKLSK